jgi:hypothetical protein
MNEDEIVERVGRAIAWHGDEEDYMEDCIRYDKRARAAIAAHKAALTAAGFIIMPRAWLTQRQIATLKYRNQCAMVDIATKKE